MYIISANISFDLSISCNNFVIVMEYKTVHLLPAILVDIGRSVHRMESIASSHLWYKIRIYTSVIPETVTHPCQLQWLANLCRGYFYILLLQIHRSIFRQQGGLLGEIDVKFYLRTLTLYLCLCLYVCVSVPRLLITIVQLKGNIASAQSLLTL